MHAASPLARLGWDDRRAAELSDLRIAGAVPARIARVDRGGGLAIAEGGELAVRGAGLAAGDWAAVADGAVAAVLPRRSTLSRRAAGAAAAEQVIAANVDVVLVVHGLDRPLRCAASTARSRWPGTRAPSPAVVLTKADLAAAAPAEALLADAALGVDVHTVSAATGRGVDEIAALAAPARTLVLLGESGAGKSRLANALLGREALPRPARCATATPRAATPRPPAT